MSLCPASCFVYNTLNVAKLHIELAFQYVTDIICLSVHKTGTFGSTITWQADLACQCGWRICPSVHVTGKIGLSLFDRQIWPIGVGDGQNMPVSLSDGQNWPVNKILWQARYGPSLSEIGQNFPTARPLVPWESWRAHDGHIMSVGRPTGVNIKMAIKGSNTLFWFFSPKCSVHHHF